MKKLFFRCHLIVLCWFPNILGAEELAGLFTEVYTLQNRGYVVPVDILDGLHNLRRTDAPADSKELRHYRRWLAWLVYSQEKLGTSDFVNEPLTVGSSVDLLQIYRVGTEIAESGGILIAKHWQHNAEFQTVNSNLPNFIRISVNREDVTFGVTTVPRYGVNGGLDSAIDLHFFPVLRGSLVPGDEVTIEYRNLALPNSASQGFSLPLYFRTDINSGFYQVPQTLLQLHAGPVQNADILVPSRLNPGETFVTKILLKDSFGNPAVGRAPSFDVLVDGSLHSRIPAGSRNYHELTSIEFESRGDHLIEVRSSGGGISGKSNPFAVQYDNYRIFWGDPNSHINLGEGNVSVTELSAKRDLDFFVTAMHNKYLTPVIWQALPDLKAWLWGDQIKQGGHHLAITREQPLYPGSQTELMRLLQPETFTTIALPEVPADDRFLNNQVVRLVEMISRDSHFEWFANRLLAKGYRLGFTASNHSHLTPIGKGETRPLTAVIATVGETWSEALFRGSTFVTTGDRIMLEVTVNDEFPGGRVSSSNRRQIKGFVKGTAPIQKVELIKNGSVIDERDFTADSDSKTLKVSLYSDSAPVDGQRALARNGREWIGFLRSQNMTLIELAAPGFRNKARQALALNPTEENRVDFITWTRGKTSSFMIDFSEDNEDAVVELNFRNGHEDVDVAPSNRPSAEIPGYRQRVSLFELQDGPVIRQQRVSGYKDTITLELINKNAASNVEFDFIDQSSTRQGDYYYVRVLQLDDQMAWSSPVFVGGFDQP